MPVNDLPEFPTQIEVGFGVRCQDCGAEANPPHQPVAKYPDPTSEDERGRHRCRDCYVEVLRDATGIKKSEAEVLAMLVLGFSHKQIASGIGRGSGRVDKLAKRVRDRAKGPTPPALDAVMAYL